MSTSLRSRLWWSYVLVTGAALAVVALVLFIYIIQNPSSYRQASARLTVVATILRKNEGILTGSNAAQLNSLLQQIDNNYGTRVVIYNNRRQLIADSRSGQKSFLRMPLFPRLRISSVTRDQDNMPWLYIIQHLQGGRWLMVAVPRPVVPLLSVLGDELVLPIVVAGAVALFVSLLVAFWLARWIGSPLQHVVEASRKMPSPDTRSVELHGPREVLELSQAFNEMNVRVLESQKSQRDFVANVSHELKTPLTSVQGFAQALLDGTAETPDSRRQAASIIYEEAGRMHRLVLDLLDLARLDAGTLDLQRAPVDIAALLKNVADRFSPQARLAGVTIQLETSSLATIMGDGDRLAQVFTNLVDNALKNTPSGGQIILCARQNGSEIRIDIMDTGTGIPPESLPHIFERFYQADLSRSGGAAHGTGLGLAIVKEIVSAHGGKISVQSQTKSIDSQGKGSGSTFTILIPLVPPENKALVSKRRRS